MDILVTLGRFMIWSTDKAQKCLTSFIAVFDACYDENFIKILF